MKSKMLIPLMSSLLSAITPAQAQSQNKTQRPPQYILISFDGGYTNEMWKATRDQALASNAKVTHFISGVDFLKGSSQRHIPDAVDHIYIPPRYKGGRRSDVGFGGDRGQVANRIHEMKKSMDAGMEIGGHANAHFNGTNWTKEEWQYEFNLFNEYVTNVFKINSLNEEETGVRVDDWKDSLRNQLRSFRAPYLGRGQGLWSALSRPSWTIDNEQRGRITYDASDIAKSPTEWPEKSQLGFWYLRMAVIPVPGLTHGTLSMDYNFYSSQSADPNNPKENPEKAPLFEEQTYQAYVNWFMRNYYGNRAPLNIGHHFSTWNRGAYWRALKRFMTNVCGQPEVKCLTGQEMVGILENTPSETLISYRKGDFDRTGTPRIEIEIKTQIADDDRAKQDNYRWIKDGIADLPQDSKIAFNWEIRSKKMSAKRINLIQLARAGVSRIDLVVKKLNLPEARVPMMINWNPLSNQVSLQRWREPLIKACDATAHEEAVDLNDLIDALRI